MESYLVAVMHNRHIGSLNREKRKLYGHCPILITRVNVASTIFRFASWAILVAIGCRYPLLSYWLPLGAKSKATCSLPHAEHQHQRSINDIWSWILSNLRVALWQWFIYNVLAAISGNPVHDIYITPSWTLVSMERHQFLVLYIE